MSSEPREPVDLPDAPRLRPGAALFRVDGHGAVLRAADGDLFDVALPGAALDGVARALTGPAGGDQPPEVAAFASAGHLGARAHWPAEHRAVGLVCTAGPGLDLGGHTPTAAAALARAGADVRPLGPGDDMAAAGIDALCWIHDGPPPAAWTAFDALAAKGIAWQRVSREGRHVFFEPVAASPGDPGHADVRARRLAAAGSGHQRLAAYWAGGTGDAPIEGDDRPDELEQHLISAIAAHDLRAWALGTPQRTGDLTPAALPPQRRLRVLDLDTGAISDHAVLPVPTAAP
ncbi:hypothetical protein ACFOVU_11660 [Nocardiopsis sediminis]|uniref:Uncharacterized protein n=1 Tax=Nocardiopsis sediminis TaxID=1778267 RepID=A0ABV8FMF4_9ACTN